MRYAVFADVHANLEAFDAVLEAFAGERIDEYLFVGDIVSYGTDPGACIERLQKLKPVAVAGNHEWAVTGKLSFDYFTDHAKAALEWTVPRLLLAHRDYLASWELVRENRDWALAHGTLFEPQEFHYVEGLYEAQKNFGIQKGHVCFVAHSHVPAVFISFRGGIDIIDEPGVKLEMDHSYIINVGSVGQPRDGDPRACYCLYNDEAGIVSFKRVRYDVEAAQRKIRKAGLPRILADRLEAGR